MSWNYRVTYRPKEPLLGYQIREVFYDENGVVKFYTVNPVSAFGDLPEELEKDLNMMADALNKEPLNLDHVDYLLESKSEE
jgi:hypothetical protein